MESKVCSKCNTSKSLSEYEFRTDTNKYRNVCKECRSKQAKNWRNSHQKEIKKYREDNKNHIKAQAKIYYEEHADFLKEYSRDYYYEHKEESNKKSKEWRKSNKNYISEYNKKYSETHAKEILEKHREYINNNREIVNHKRNIHVKKRKENDSFFRYKEQVRHLIIKSFIRKGYTKSSKTFEILGCDYKTLLNHLKKTYKKNYGIEWDEKEEVQVDHIIPLAAATTEEEVIRLCHYTNLQLLKPKDNLEKRAKLDWKISNLDDDEQI